MFASLGDFCCVIVINSEKDCNLKMSEIKKKVCHVRLARVRLLGSHA